MAVIVRDFHGAGTGAEQLGPCHAEPNARELQYDVHTIFR